MSGSLTLMTQSQSFLVLTLDMCNGVLSSGSDLPRVSLCIRRISTPEHQQALRIRMAILEHLHHWISQLIYGISITWWRVSELLGSI